MSFKITITNNDNGEVLVNEENALGIIGAVTGEDGNVGEMGFCAADSLKIAVTCVAAQKSVNRIKNANETISLVCELVEKMHKVKELEDK